MISTEMFTRAPTRGDAVNEGARDGELPQGQLIVVPVVQHVQQVRVEGVDVVHLPRTQVR